MPNISSRLDNIENRLGEKLCLGKHLLMNYEWRGNYYTEQGEPWPDNPPDACTCGEVVIIVTSFLFTTDFGKNNPEVMADYEVIKEKIKKYQSINPNHEV